MASSKCGGGVGWTNSLAARMVGAPPLSRPASRSETVLCTSLSLRSVATLRVPGATLLRLLVAKIDLAEINVDSLAKRPV